METLTLNFILLYILFPVIACITAVATYFFNKKKKLFANKKIIFTLLLSATILGLPGIVGLVDYWFMPYIYIFLGIGYFVLGTYNLLLINHLFKEIRGKGYVYECSLFIIQMILGVGLFSLLFNLCNELKYGLWASTCILPYIFVSLYLKTYRSFIDIPLEIYKVWSHDPDKKVDVLDLSQCKDVLKIELYKKIEDHVPHRIIAKSKDDLQFGEWFQYILDDYNSRGRAETIDYFDIGNTFGWIFYVKPSFFLPRRYIDPDLTIGQNKLNRPYVIIAIRVRQEKQI